MILTWRSMSLIYLLTSSNLSACDPFCRTCSIYLLFSCGLCYSCGVSPCIRWPYVKVLEIGVYRTFEKNQRWRVWNQRAGWQLNYITHVHNWHKPDWTNFRLCPALPWFLTSHYWTSFFNMKVEFIWLSDWLNLPPHIWLIWNDSEPWISDYFLVSLIFDSSLIDYSCLTLPACLSTKIVHVIYCQELMIGIFVFGYFNNCKFNFSVITHCYLVDDIQCAKSFWWFKCEKFPSAFTQTQLSYDSTLQLWSSQSTHEISVFAYQWPDFWQFQHLSLGEGPLLPLPSSKI